MTIAATIIDQLGGNRFIAMTGANRFYAFPDGVSFRIPTRSAKNGINSVMITLTPDDLYDIEFGAVRAMKYTVKSAHEGIYCDQLVEIFESETGLYTHL
jgi:hypothetical protein